MTDSAKTGKNDAAAERLKAVRTYFKLSQADFAKRAGIAKTTYNNFETGVQRPSLNAAMRLREVYGISLDFIYCGSLDTLPHKIAVALSSKPSASETSTSTVKPD